MSMYGETSLNDYLVSRLGKLRSEVESQRENYILNVSETQFVEYLVGEFTIENVQLKVSDVHVSSSEKGIPAELFPSDFNVYDGKVYTRIVVKYHIPAEGNINLLRYLPCIACRGYPIATLENDSVCYEIVNFRDDPEDIIRRSEEYLSRICEELTGLRSEIDSYNQGLKAEATRAFQSRKQRYLKANDLLAGLGVPLKKRDHIPDTFTIPSPKISKRLTISKPEVRDAGFKPEPTLDESSYVSILNVIHDLGKQFERMPSTFLGKREEHLRDHFLLFLEPRFEGSATGETFNKSGKTDILLRHEGRNVFIAECKFWKGGKAHLDTISQLLGYLTWRDSKAAIILFVQSGDFSSVITEVETITPQHSNFLGYVGKADETWVNYRFHIEGDPNREVKLAILLFHFPLSKRTKGGGS